MGKAGELHRRSQGDTAVVDSVDGEGPGAVDLALSGPD
jgi:hypothetical protein